MSSNLLLETVRGYLASLRMFAEDEWLTGCVEFLTGDVSNNYNDQDIKNLAREQWLLNDLKDICPGSLPQNLRNNHKTVLKERYVLQILGAVDIGTPAYQQYLKIQKVNTENIEVTTKYEDKIPHHRMIKLYLTDGVQDVSAIEYKPMRNLSCDIKPGTKVLIKGPVLCRRGVILLTESTLELLGGEVEELAESNSLSSILCSKLGLPQETSVAMTCQPRNTNIPMPHTEIPSDFNLEDQGFESTFEQWSRPVARVTSVQVADNLVEDDINFNQSAVIEAQIDHTTSKRPLDNLSSKPEKKIKIDPVLTVNKTEDYPTDDDLLVFEDDEYLREVEDKFYAQEIVFNSHKGVVAVSPEPYIYIKQLKDMKENDKIGRIFKVKGQIMKLLSKLSLGKEGWTLKCSIIDGTGSIDVEFTSDVLSKLVGFTPEEMVQLKKNMVSKPELKESFNLALQKAKESLQVLNCIIELTIIDVPKITRLIPFQESHLSLLEKRIQDSGL